MGDSLGDFLGLLTLTGLAIVSTSLLIYAAPLIASTLPAIAGTIAANPLVSGTIIGSVLASTALRAPVLALGIVGAGIATGMGAPAVALALGALGLTVNLPEVLTSLRGLVETPRRVMGMMGCLGRGIVGSMADYWDAVRGRTPRSQVRAEAARAQQQAAEQAAQQQAQQQAAAQQGAEQPGNAGEQSIEQRLANLERLLTEREQYIAGLEAQLGKKNASHKKVTRAAFTPKRRGYNSKRRKNGRRWSNAGRVLRTDNHSRNEPRRLKRRVLRQINGRRG
jgi:hypothetical protein